MASWSPANVLTGSEQWGALPPAWTGLDSKGNLLLPKLGVPFTGSRGVLRDGGMQNWDMSIFKNIPLGKNEARYLQLRGEAFNIFNHPNFDQRDYGANLSAPSCSGGKCTPMSIAPANTTTFGHYISQYSGVGGPRVLQLAAKIYF
jgi:hypothetical protein